MTSDSSTLYWSSEHFSNKVNLSVQIFLSTSRREQMRKVIKRGSKSIFTADWGFWLITPFNNPRVKLVNGNSSKVWVPMGQKKIWLIESLHFIYPGDRWRAERLLSDRETGLWKWIWWFVCVQHSVSGKEIWAQLPRLAAELASVIKKTKLYWNFFLLCH